MLCYAILSYPILSYLIHTVMLMLMAILRMPQDNERGSNHGEWGFTGCETSQTQSQNLTLAPYQAAYAMVPLLLSQLVSKGSLLSGAVGPFQVLIAESCPRPDLLTLVAWHMAVHASSATVLYRVGGSATPFVPLLELASIHS